MALLLGSGVFVVVAALVRASSPGPVFHRQPRVGRHGRLFDMLKFRSMRVSCDRPAVTAAGDPRITRVGAVLRRWKLDELPQLWNVLRGEMTLVGPRPELEKFVRLYSPAQRQILDATPGLAGMAQLAYPHEAEWLRGAHDPEAAYIQGLLPLKLAADLEYERRRTPASDFVLMWRLALMVARGGRRAPPVGAFGRQHA